MAADKNRFAPELNEEEVIELLENATSWIKKKATQYLIKQLLFHSRLLDMRWL